MPKINVTPTDINRAAAYAKRIFREADADKTGNVYKKEIDRFQGTGKASLQKVYAYARHLQAARQDVDAEKGVNLVSLRVANDAVSKLAKTAKAKAASVGDKDGTVDGNELKLHSTAGAALVRLAHALKQED